MSASAYQKVNSSPRSIATGEKTCTRCGLTKNLEDFARHNRRLDGRQSWCLVCSRKDVRERRAQGLDLAGDKGRRHYRRALSELQRRHKDEFRVILDEIRQTKP